MKVGVNARTFSVDEPGGAVQAAKTVTTELASRSAIDLVLFGHGSIAEEFPGVTIDDSQYPVSSQVYGLAWERSVLPRLAARHEVDVLYCPNGNGPLHEIPCPVVMCIADVNAQRGLSSPVQRLYRRATVPRAAVVADALVTISEFSKGEIVEVMGISPKKIETVYYGIDPLFCSDEPGDSLDLPTEYILFVGAMNPRKNIERLVRAFDLLKHRTDLAHKLVLIGPQNKTVFQELEIEATDDLVLPGFVSKEQLKFAYDNASLFAYPSLYEGLGLPPIEAMACGTPVLSSNVTSLPEVIGDAGELVDPRSTATIADGMERVLTDREYRDRLVERGRKRAARFTWEQAADRIVQLFKEIVYGAGYISSRPI